MAPTISEIQRIVWGSMLDADLNVRYWGYLARRYHRNEKLAKILLAVASSSTVGSWLIWEQYPVAWKILSGVSAIVALVLPIVDWSGKVRVMAGLRGKWSQLRDGYERLWAKRDRMSEDGMDEALKELKEKENELLEPESNLPHDEKLIQQCYEQVKISRGLV